MPFWRSLTCCGNRKIIKQDKKIIIPNKMAHEDKEEDFNAYNDDDEDSEDDKEDEEDDDEE